jgi:hypothetical protein
MAAIGLALGTSAQTLQYQPVKTMAASTITPIYIAAGDFNGDGKPDFAVPDYLGKTISIYLNQGGGSFAAPLTTTLAIGDTLGSILSGDLNEDGKTDLVVSTVAGDQAAIVLLSNGDGTFAAQPPIAGSFGFISGKVADFNGDKHADLFLGGNGSPYLYLGKGDGSFSQSSVGSAPSGSFTGTSAADFNGDGHLDGVLVEYGDPPGTLGHIDVFPGNASGSLGSAGTFQPARMGNPEEIDTADFNHDGKVDLLISASGAAFLAPGNGDGTFQFQTAEILGTYAGYNAPGAVNPDTPNVVTADLDENGSPDAILLDAALGQLSLLLNDGTGVFPDAYSTPYRFTLPVGSYHLAVADFNGDGLPDIVAVSKSSQAISLLLSMKEQTAVNLSGPAGPVIVGSPVNFTVSVAGGSKTPTGSIDLLDGNMQIGQQTLDSTGAATFSLTGLSAGDHDFTASYSGDPNHAAATSANVSQAISDFSASVTPSAQTVSAGSSVTYALTVTPEWGFTGTVTVSCDASPVNPNCNAGASSGQIVSGAITIPVVATIPAVSTAKARGPGGLVYASFLLGFWMFFRARAIRDGTAAWCVRIAPIVFASILMIGCGGGSKSNSTPPPSQVETIEFHVTGSQSGNPQAIASHTVTATLTIQ